MKQASPLSTTRLLTLRRLLLRFSRRFLGQALAALGFGGHLLSNPDGEVGDMGQKGEGPAPLLHGCDCCKGQAVAVLTQASQREPREERLGPEKQASGAARAHPENPRKLIGG